MSTEVQNPQINSAKIPVAGNIAGAIFALGAVAICFTGLPLVRVMLPAALLLGVAIAVVLRFGRHKKVGAPWIPK